MRETKNIPLSRIWYFKMLPYGALNSNHHASTGHAYHCSDYTLNADVFTTFFGTFKYLFG